LEIPQPRGLYLHKNEEKQSNEYIFEIKSERKQEANEHLQVHIKE
jgi:hypothetical protein